MAHQPSAKIHLVSRAEARSRRPLPIKPDEDSRVRLLCSDASKLVLNNEDVLQPENETEEKSDTSVQCVGHQGLQQRTVPLYHRFDTLPSVYQQLVIDDEETRASDNNSYQCQEVSLWFPEENEELNQGRKWETTLAKE